MKQKVFFFPAVMLAAIVFATIFSVPKKASADITDVFVTNMPSVSGSLSSFEERYHLNLESLQNQGENFNVSAQKGQSPQVLLYFSPSDPKPGSEMEARAFPEFFGNEKDTLYYTWYIRRKGCELDDSPSEEKLKLCDRDSSPSSDDWRYDRFGNRRVISVEDWKIEAMQSIVAGNFDSTCSLNGSLTDEERADCAENMYNSGAPSRVNPTGNKGNDPDEDGYRATYGGDGKLGQHSYCYIHDFEDGENYELTSGCEHLFPDSYRIDGNGRIERDGNIGENDDAFPIDEEHFWRTDPEDPSTAQNGNKDEANIAGLGQGTFKWTYQPEDRVGVVVEGASLYTTKYDDSSMMIMWALSKNVCDVVGKGTKQITTKGFSSNETAQVTINTSTTDINDCLEDNLVDPTEGAQAENVDVSLSYEPESPSAKLIPWGDSTVTDAKTIAQTGNILTVHASSSNTGQSAALTNYTWRVQASSDGTFNTRFSDENVWTDITEDLQTAKNISMPNGNNVSSLSINLNLNSDSYTDEQTNTVVPGFGEYFVDDAAYFRITVSATTNFAGSVSQSGSSSVVVKIVANKSIDVYDVDTVSDSATGLISVKRNDTALCTANTFQQTICPVLNNQIVGVFLSTGEGEVRDYAWTLNGHSLACTSRVSGECNDSKQGAVNFFPVSGNVGDMYVVTVVANNAETGKSFTVSRRFQIVDPDFDIISNETETAWPKYLGKYVNLDGSESDDMSKTSFEGVVGGVAQLSAVFRPSVLGTFILNGVEAGDDQNEMIWSINGSPFKWNDTGLSLALDGNVGDIYTVTLSGAYNQPRKFRKALYDIWRISPFSSETVRFSKEIQIQLVTLEGQEDARGKSNTFFASVFSAVPPFVLFSVRLILSMGMILLIVGVVFSLAPEEERGNVK